MFNETTETAMPEFISDFLKAHLNLSQYESMKKFYSQQMTNNNDVILQHLEKSYALANFWRNIYLFMVSDKSVEKGRKHGH